MGARVSRDGVTGLGKGATETEAGAAGEVETLVLAGGGAATELEGCAGRADGMAAPATDMAFDSSMGDQGACSQGVRRRTAPLSGLRAIRSRVNFRPL